MDSCFASPAHLSNARDERPFRQAAGALALVALDEGVVASRVDGAGDTAAALDEALDAAAAARERMRAALVERLSSG